MIKSTLRRSIRRAQVHDLIARNVVELIDLPPGKPGRPSRAMTEDQAARVLKAATGRATAYVKVVKASNGRYGATHAATESGVLACGTRPHVNAKITEVSRELEEATCRSCRTQLGLDAAADANQRLAALFTLSITLGLRPGELRKLTWDLVDLDRGVVHVWRSASMSGDTKTAKSKRSLELPKRAITALQTHKAMQDRERAAAGQSWQENDLVFCHEDGSMYTSDALNWRFSKMTRKAGLGHWHAHEGRHTAVSIMASRPPAASARRHLFADIRDTRNLAATSRSLAPASISSAASSRTRLALDRSLTPSRGQECQVSGLAESQTRSKLSR